MAHVRPKTRDSQANQVTVRILVSILAAVLLGIAVSGRADRMPRGAFLRRPAPDVSALLRQLRSDPVTLARYTHLLHMSPHQVLEAFAHLHLTHLKRDLLLKVHYVHPGEHLGYRLRRVRTGTYVFALLDGTPALAQVCGNPLQASLDAGLARSKPQMAAPSIPDFTPDEPVDRPVTAPISLPLPIQDVRGALPDTNLSASPGDSNTALTLTSSDGVDAGPGQFGSPDTSSADTSSAETSVAEGDFVPVTEEADKATAQIGPARPPDLSLLGLSALELLVNWLHGTRWPTSAGGGYSGGGDGGTLLQRNPIASRAPTSYPPNNSPTLLSPDLPSVPEAPISIVMAALLLSALLAFRRFIA